ncbi:MAG: 50S ribosomal protein L9 [Chrysiogenetes bacterium]|nr:50S ribosomal protein L9 [Chrysiogenetes bacterium]
MRVILQENIETLGAVGEIVNVKPGYARNYLLPKGLVLVANESAVKEWEHKQRVTADRIRKLRLSAEGVAKQLKGVKVEISAKVGEGERLFGSVGNADILKGLIEKGFGGLSRKDIHLPRPIKTLGEHTVSVKLHPEVSTDIIVDVVRSADSPPPVETKSKTDEILEKAAAEEQAAAASEDEGNDEEA